MDSKWYIVRGDRSGVFFGHIARREGSEVEIADARQIWYWSGAANLLQMAAEGVKKPGDCKFTQCVSSLTIIDAIEVLPCTDEAAECIRGVKEWKV